MIRNVRMTSFMFNDFNSLICSVFPKVSELDPMDFSSVISLEIDSENEEIKTYAVIPVKMLENDMVLVGFKDSYILSLWEEKDAYHKEYLNKYMWFNLTSMGFEHVYDEYEEFTGRLYGTAREIYEGKCVHQRIFEEDRQVG
jgi:hypothetical protein